MTLCVVCVLQVEGDNAARAASEVAGIMAVFRLAHHKLQEAGVMGAGSSGAVVASGSGAVQLGVEVHATGY